MQICFELIVEKDTLSFKNPTYVQYIYMCNTWGYMALRVYCLYIERVYYLLREGRPPAWRRLQSLLCRLTFGCPGKEYFATES